MFIILSIHTRRFRSSRAWRGMDRFSRGDRLRGTRVGSRNIYIYMVGSRKLLSSCISVPSLYLLRCKDWLVIISVADDRDWNRRALSSIRSQSLLLQTYNNSVASSTAIHRCVGKLVKGNILQIVCTKDTNGLCNISCHVTSRVNDRHYLLVIRVQNFARTRWCRHDGTCVSFRNKRIITENERVVISHPAAHPIDRNF